MVSMVRSQSLVQYQLHKFIIRLIPIFLLNSISLLIWTITTDETLGIIRDLDSNTELFARTISYAVAGLWFELFIYLGVIFKHPYVSRLQKEHYLKTALTCVIISIGLALLTKTGSSSYFFVNIIASIILIEIVLKIQQESENFANLLFCLLLLFGLLASDFRIEMISADLGLWERLRFSVAFFVFITITLLAIRNSGIDRKIFIGFFVSILFMYLLNSISPESVFGWGIARPLILMMILLSSIPSELDEQMQSQKFILKLGLGSLITTPILEIIEIVLPFVSIISATLLALVLAILLSQTKLKIDPKKYSIERSILSQKAPIKAQASRGKELA